MFPKESTVKCCAFNIRYDVVAHEVDIGIITIEAEIATSLVQLLHEKVPCAPCFKAFSVPANTKLILNTEFSKSFNFKHNSNHN